MGAEPEEGLKRGVWIAASVVTKDVLIQVHAIDTEAAAFANL